MSPSFSRLSNRHPAYSGAISLVETHRNILKWQMSNSRSDLESDRKISRVQCSSSINVVGTLSHRVMEDTVEVHETNNEA